MEEKKSPVGMIILIIVLVALGGWAISKRKAATAPTGQVIKIGVIAPLTGSEAILGEGIKNAVELAKSQLSNTRYTYEVILEDDQMKGDQTATVANKLINVDKVDAILSFTSGSGNVVAPIAENAGILHFGIASDLSIAQNNAHSFLHWTPPAEEVKVLISELQKKNIARIGLFRVNQQGVTAAFNELQKQLQGTQISIVSDQKYDPGVKDFRTMIAKAKQDNPQIYLLAVFSPELELIAKQLKESGNKLPVTSIESFDYTDQTNLFEGQWYVTAADPSATFSDAYMQKYGKAPSLGSANEYDIFNMIVAATEKIKSKQKPTSEEIMQNLFTLKDFPGALGSLTIGTDRIVNSQAIVKVIKNGKSEPVAQ